MSRCGPSGPGARRAARMPPRWPTPSVDAHRAGCAGRRCRDPGPLRRQRHERLDRRVPRRALHRRRARGWRQPQGGRDGGHRARAPPPRPRAPTAPRAPTRDAQGRPRAGRARSCCSSSTASASAPTHRRMPSPRPGCRRGGGLLAELAALPAGRLGAGRRAARGPDGQQRGGPPEHRCRPAGAPGPAAHRCRHRRWLVLRQPGPRGSCPDRRPARPSTASGQPHRSGRCPRQRPAPGRHRRAGPARGRPRRGGPRAARRAGHAAAVGGPASWPTWRRVSPPRTRRARDRDHRRPLLRHGPRPALGARRPGLRGASSMGSGCTPRRRARHCWRPTPAARTTSS